MTRFMNHPGIITLAVSILLVACGGAPSGSPTAESPVAEGEARTMAEQMLAAYNEGDYEAWSANWSPRMKDAIGSEAFASFRQQAIEVAGEFQQINSAALRPARDRSDAVRWEFTSQFARGTFVLTIVFIAGSDQIEGVDFQAAAP